MGSLGGVIRPVYAALFRGAWGRWPGPGTARCWAAAVWRGGGLAWRSSPGRRWGPGRLAKPGGCTDGGGAGRLVQVLSDFGRRSAGRNRTQGVCRRCTDPGGGTGRRQVMVLAGGSMDQLRPKAIFADASPIWRAPSPFRAASISEGSMLGIGRRTGDEVREGRQSFQPGQKDHRPGSPFRGFADES